MELPFVLSAQIRLRHLRDDLRFEMQDARDDQKSSETGVDDEKNIRSNKKVILPERRDIKGKGKNTKRIDEFFHEKCETCIITFFNKRRAQLIWYYEKWCWSMPRFSLRACGINQDLPLQLVQIRERRF